MNIKTKGLRNLYFVSKLLNLKGAILFWIGEGRNRCLEKETREPFDYAQGKQAPALHPQ